MSTTRMTATQWDNANVARACPFCGHKAAVEIVKREGTKGEGITVRCINGFCEVRPRLGPLWNRRQSVIAIWNERKRKS